MTASYKHIAVFMDGSAQSAGLGRYAARLASSNGALLVGVFGVARDADARRTDAFARGERAIEAVIERQRQETADLAMRAGRQFSDIVREFDLASEFRVVWGDPGSENALQRLQTDLIVTAQPKPPHLPSGWSAEHLLQRNGAPVLLLPAGWADGSTPRHVVIAWNGSPKARRAVNDAMPLLGAADRVTVLVVDPDRKPELHGDQPGADVVDLLARHGVKAATAIVASHGHPVSEVLAAEAAAREADLVVIGAYSRSRAAELIFGGVTRALLARAPRPLFLSN